MPLYTYECSTCAGIEEAFRSIANRNQAPECSVCGTITKKIISGYSVVGDVEPYYDDNLQSYIKSKQHRKQVMREQGVMEKYGRNWK